MQKRSAVAAPVVSQIPSVMSLLEQNGSKRATSAQIISRMNQISANYHTATPLNEMVDNVPYIRSIGSRIMEEFYSSESRDRVTEELAGSTATNFSRMNFFLEAGTFGLNLTLNAQDETSKRQRAIAIEALLSAAYFGSGRASQLLIEQNEIGVITLTAEEIQQLIQAQIYWHDKAFGPYNAETGRHDYTNVDASLQAAQALPVLLTHKKAWDAMRQSPALFNDVLRAVYHSGRAIQALLDADQLGTVVNLTNAERRQLVQAQINQYFAAQVEEATIKVEDQQTPLLTIPSKVWDAFMEAPKESWNALLQFLKDLDTELPEHLRMASPEALAVFTEENPMAFKTYFESKAAQALVLIADLDVTTRNHIETRNRIMQAMFGLRHAAFKPDNKALLDMRPAIATKKKANDEADLLAAAAIAEKAKDIAKGKEVVKTNTAKTTADLKLDETQDISRQTVSYKREGFEKAFRSSLNTESLAVAFDKRDKNPGVAKYQERIEIFMSTEQGLAYQARKAEREQRSVTLRQDEQAAYDRLDTELATFKATKESEKQARIAELEAMKAEEKASNQALVESNPLTESVRWLFLIAAQDLAMFGTLTQDWLKDLEALLAQDLRAFNKGEFAVEFTAKTMTAGEKSKEKLPLHMLNNSGYLALFDIYRRDPANFRKNIQDQLFDFNGRVMDVNALELLKDFPVNSNAKKNTESSIRNAVAYYAINEYVDSLSHVFNQLMILKMFVMVTEISPQYDLRHTQYLEEAAILRNRLNKVIVEKNASLFINYVKIVLLALQDQQVFASLLTGDKKQLSKDVNNPFHGVLEHYGLTASYDLINTEDLAEVKLAMKQLANNSVDIYTPENINNRYTIISFFKTLLNLTLRIDVKEAKKSAGDFDQSIADQLSNRNLAGAETVIDAIVLQFFDDCTLARTAACFEKTGASFEIDSNAWIHTRTAKVLRGLSTAQPTRRLSVSSEGSPIRRQSSSAVTSSIMTMSTSSSASAAAAALTTATGMTNVDESQGQRESRGSMLNDETSNVVASGAEPVVEVPVEIVEEAPLTTSALGVENTLTPPPAPPRPPAPPVVAKPESQSVPTEVLGDALEVVNAIAPAKETVTTASDISRKRLSPVPPPPPGPRPPAPRPPAPPASVVVAKPESQSVPTEVLGDALEVVNAIAAAKETVTTASDIGSKTLSQVPPPPPRRSALPAPLVVAKPESQSVPTEVLGDAPNVVNVVDADANAIAKAILPENVLARRQSAAGASLADMIAARRKTDEEEAFGNTQAAYDVVEQRKEEEKKSRQAQMDQEIARKKAANEKLTLEESQRNIYLATTTHEDEDDGYESPEEDDDIKIDLTTGKVTGIDQWNEQRVYSVNPSHHKLPMIFAKQPAMLAALEQINAGTFVPGTGLGSSSATFRPASPVGTESASAVPVPGTRGQG